MLVGQIGQGVRPEHYVVPTMVVHTDMHQGRFYSKHTTKEATDQSKLGDRNRKTQTELDQQIRKQTKNQTDQPKFGATQNNKHKHDRTKNMPTKTGKIEQRRVGNIPQSIRTKTIRISITRKRIVYEGRRKRMKKNKIDTKTSNNNIFFVGARRCL